MSKTKSNKAGSIKAQATYKAGPYKGYFGHAEYDAEARIFHGDVIGTRDVITFEGKTIDDLNKEFCESIEDYLDMCKDSGRPPERPFSGNFVVRIPPELHKRASRLAEERGISMNALVAELIENAVGEAQPKRLRKKQA